MDFTGILHWLLSNYNLLIICSTLLLICSFVLRIIKHKELIDTYFQNLIDSDRDFFQFALNSTEWLTFIGVFGYLNEITHSGTATVAYALVLACGYFYLIYSIQSFFMDVFNNPMNKGKLFTYENIVIYFLLNIGIYFVKPYYLSLIDLVVRNIH